MGADLGFSREGDKVTINLA